MPPRVTSAPSVPEQHVIVLPLVVESRSFPPDVPSLIGKGCRAGLACPVPGERMVTLALPERVGSTGRAGGTETVGGFGTFAAAVSRPEGVIVPTVLFPPGTPFTLQSTAVCEVPVTL